ncbi:MAG: ROK family glucokinase [Lachnospiraceae bacterium]|nr:ROK family glucokinase [Lachnospiraceae bacterium]MDE6974372.1 ROK family glucokinase [Lachnospiraceae bacterium]
MGKYVVGVDVGGTTVKLGFFDTEGVFLDKWEIPTRVEEEGSHILPDVAESIKKKLEEKRILFEDVAGVGIGAPGPIDSNGVVYKAVNLGWNVFSIKEKLEEHLKLPVMAGNDANVAALGEMWKGGGLGSRNLVMVTLGTGVGGGIIVDGRILTGFTGAGGEIGHIHVEDQEAEVCGCGNKGCLEQYASATGITRLANRKLKESGMDSMLRNGKISARTVFDAVKAKDALAMEVAEEFGRYLGNGLAGVACVVNPEVIVIGGGVSNAGEILIDYIRPYYEKSVFHGSRSVKFSLATLGNDAGIYGAAKLVLDSRP